MLPGISLKRLLKSFYYAIKGIRCAYSNGQANIKIHTILAIISIILGIVLSINPVEWIIIIACIGVVISAEIVNTATESLVDWISPDWQEQAGRVKDLAAGAVLILAITAAVIGAIIFIPKIIALF